MKINELIAEPQIDEGVGDILGKTAGHVVGATKAAGRGLKGMWKDAKAGYAAGKGAWDPKDAGTDSAPTGGAPAATTSGDISSILQTIDKLDQPAKQQLASELEKNIAATPKTPEPAAATAPATTTPAPPAASSLSQAERDAHRAAGGKFDNQTGQKIPLPATTPPAAGTAPDQSAPAANAPQDFAAKRTAAAQSAQAQMAPVSKLPPNIIRPQPTTTAAKPVANFGQQTPNYAKTTINAPAGIPSAAPAQTAPTVTTPTTAPPAGRRQGGGKVAGQVSSAPRAVARRAARAAAKTPAAEGIEFHSRFLGMTI